MNTRNRDANPTILRRDNNRSGDARSKGKDSDRSRDDNRGGSDLRIGGTLPNKSQSMRQAEHTKPKPTFTELYGTINTIKQGFGFIQPIVDEEQIYFGGRELQPDMKIGDRVGFILRESVRGLAAENVRLLSAQMDKVVSSVKGNVTRNPDRHRSTFGMAGLELTTTDPKSAALLEAAGLKEVTFAPSDVIPKSIPKGHRLDKGDYVEFSVYRVIGSNLYVAKNVTMLQLKRDRVIAQEVQRLLDAGAVREQGIITTLKKGEYGFIKPLDRKDEIYFRMEVNNSTSGKDPDTMLVENEDSKLVETSEVEFFVITECVKGKMSDRAIHVRSIPKGTVKYELVLASAVRAVVIAESGARPEESPGIARLDTPVSVTPTNTSDTVLTAAAAALAKKTGAVAGEAASIKTIELWQRCLPDELVCRVGDVLTLDVHYYRPEKLFFARAVRVVQFRSLGRERGVVVALKDNGFGFIQSSVRSADAYFKSTHVLGYDSLPLTDGALKIGSSVSFDVICEDTHSGGKLRAKRVVLESPAAALARATADAERYLLKRDVTGVVVRNSTKKDSPGLIKLHSPAALEDTTHNIEIGDPDFLAALTEFQSTADLHTVTLYALPLSTLRTYSKVIESQFVGIAHESCPTDTQDSSLGHNMKIFKLDTEKYNTWKTTPRKVHTERKSGVGEQMTIQFYKDDYVSTEYGLLANDLKVVFNLCYEPAKGKIVAKQIRLVDEVVYDSSGVECSEVVGVVDVMVDKGEKYGFIRCIPSDEKLFYYMTSVNTTSSATSTNTNTTTATTSVTNTPVMLGSEVRFQLRRRGGLRCATHIQTLPPGTLSVESTLPESCIALLTGPGQAILIDVTNTTQLCRKYLDTRLISECVVTKKESSTSGGGWNKLSMGDSTTALVVPDMSSLDISATGSPVDIKGSSVGNGVSSTSVSAGGNSGTSGGDEDTPVSEGESSASDFKAKFFSVLPRLPVSVTLAPGVTPPLAGELVVCNVSVNWAVQRSPVRLTVHGPVTTNTTTTANTTSTKALKKKGRISRLKFRVRNTTTSEYVTTDTLQCYNVSSIDFIELSDTNYEDSSHSVDALGQFFYCQATELTSEDNKGEKEVPQVGDEVEFWVVPSAGPCAFGVKLLPKLSTRDHGIQFSKRPVAAVAVDNRPKYSPLNLITMAEGPPNDAAAGFPAGWRALFSGSTVEEEHSRVASLPWAFLLK